MLYYRHISDSFKKYAKRLFYTYMKKYIILILLSFVALGAHAQLNKQYFYYMGEKLILSEKYGEAIDMFNVLLSVDTMSADGFFLRGVAKYNLNDIIGAESDFTHAIYVNPVITRAYQYRGIARSTLGNYTGAIADFNKAIDIRPDVTELFYSRGVSFFMATQFDKAIEDFSYFIRRKPKVVDAYISRGISYLMLKDTLSAFNDYNTAVNINKFSSEGFFRRGTIYAMQGKYDNAYNDLTNSIKLDSTFIPAYFSRALVYSSTLRPKEAIKDFDKVLSLDSLSSIAYYNRAIVYSQIGDFNKAVKDYEKVSEFSPNNILAHFNRGIINSKIGALQEAEDDFSKAIEIFPDFANAYLARSNVRMSLNKLTLSKSDYEIGNQKISEYKQKMTKDSFDVYSDTSAVFNKLVSFDVDFGNKDFENIKAMDLDVTDLLLPLFRFAILKPKPTVTTIKMNNRYESKLLYKFIEDTKFPETRFDTDIIDIEKQNIELMQQQAQQKIDIERPKTWQEYYKMSVFSYSTKQYSTAISQLNNAIELNPRNAILYLMRGVIKSDMTDFIATITDNMPKHLIYDVTAKESERLKTDKKRVYSYKESIDDFGIALSLSPDFAYTYYNLGNMMFKMGDMPSAVDMYNKAIELHPSMGEAYYNRGLILLQLKDSKKGAMDLSKAGELGITSAYELLKRFGNK